MLRVIFLIIGFLPALVNAQSGQRIHFSVPENFQELLALAKKENKPIFIDAYATWCVPCKKMDAEVYTNEEVAAYVNANFISIKVQMDSTVNDDDYIKRWQKESAIFKHYADAFPSYIIFSSEGEFAGRASGYRAPGDFIELLKKNIDPNISYLALLKGFRSGTLNKSQLLNLAYLAKENKHDSIAYSVAAVYKNNYVDTSALELLLTPEADRFHSTFINLFDFSDKIIQYIYTHQDSTDIKFGRWPNYSENLIDYVISRDYIYKVIRSNKVPVFSAPRWKQIEQNIAKRFDNIVAKRLVLNAKIGWYYDRKDYNRAVDLDLIKLDVYGMDTTVMGRVFVNNMLYEAAFKHVDKNPILKRCLTVIERIIKIENRTSHTHLDTYASLLYKLGYTNKAISIEREALDMASEQKDNKSIQFYQNIITKMQAGEAIWNE